MPVFVNGIAGNQELINQATQDLSAAALAHAYVVPAGLTVQINKVTLAFDVNVTQTLTITRVYAVATYSTILLDHDIVAEDDVVWNPDGILRITGDGTAGLTVAVANAGAPAANVFSTISMEILK